MHSFLYSATTTSVPAIFYSTELAGESKPSRHANIGENTLFVVCSKVVPFWGSLISLIESKYEPQKGTTLGPMGSNNEEPLRNDDGSSSGPYITGGEVETPKKRSARKCPLPYAQSSRHRRL